MKWIIGLRSVSTGADFVLYMHYLISYLSSKEKLIFHVRYFCAVFIIPTHILSFRVEINLREGTEKVT